MSESTIKKEMELNSMATIHLKATYKWASFLAIVGFIYVALMLLMPFAMSGFIDKMAALSGEYDYAAKAAMNMSMGFFKFMMFISAAIYFTLNLLLFLFARKTKTALASKNENLLADGLKNLKQYFTFQGILTIIGLVFVLISLVAFISMASMASSFM